MITDYTYGDKDGRNVNKFELRIANTALWNTRFVFNHVCKIIGVIDFLDWKDNNYASMSI